MRILRHVVRTPVAFPALVLLTGCGAGEPMDADGPLVFDAADLRVLATSDSISVVEDVAVHPDGDVWVLNSVEPLFVAFDASGGMRAAHGRLGGAPEEFGAPAGFVGGGMDGGVWTFDRARHALIRISGPEGERAEVPLPREAVPPGSVMGGMSLMSGLVRSARLGERVVVPRWTGEGEVEATSFWTTIWNADLVALDPETDDVRTVVPLPDVLGDLASHFEAVSSGFPPFPLWYRLWAVCGDREVRLHDFRRNELRGFAPDGTELDAVPLPPPPFTEATPRQFVRAAFDLAAAELAGEVGPGIGSMSAADSQQLINGAVARIDATPAQLGAILPQYVDFRCADDGTMWLRPLDLERGGMQGGPVWVRVSPGGDAREVRFPDRFDPYRFTDGRAWGVLRDEFDVASVAWIEMGAESPTRPELLESPPPRA